MDMNQKYMVIIVNDKPALFTNGRIAKEDIPEGLYAYDLRESDDGNRYVTLEERVMVNRGGTVLLRETFDFEGSDSIALNNDTEPNFLGFELSPSEFMEYDFEQDQGPIL